MAIVGQGITAYPQPDDALNENSKNPVQNKVVAKEVNDLKSAINTIHANDVDKIIYKDEYMVAGTGKIAPYTGWDRTQFIDCRGYESILFITKTPTASANANYNGWYREDMSFISRFRILDVVGSVEYSSKDIPADAAFFLCSGPADFVAGIEIKTTTVTRFIANSANAAIKQFIGNNGKTNRAVIAINSDDLVNETIGNDTGNIYHRYTTPYIELQDGRANPIHLTITDNDYTFKVCTYYEDNDGNIVLSRDIAWTDNLIFSPQLITSGANTFWERYYRVSFSDSAVNRYLTINDKTAIAESFSAIEKPSPEKYYRICSFNMARRWGVFRDKSDGDYSKWQIEKYLNLFGKINPDILCMQEAIGLTGLYIDTDHDYNLQNTILAHKFGFNSYYVDTRFSSKFAFGPYSNTKYSTQYDSGNKQFTKAFVNMDGYKVCVFNTHTEYHGDYNEYLGPQLEELVTAMNDTLSNHEADYVIACGDFNAWKASDFDIFISNGYKIANCGDFGSKTTWAFIDYADPNDLVINPKDPTGPKISKVWNMSYCDNIIVSSNINIQNVDVVELYTPADPDDKGASWPLWDSSTDTPLALSDHYPIYADISFN